MQEAIALKQALSQGSSAEQSSCTLWGFNLGTDYHYLDFLIFDQQVFEQAVVKFFASCPYRISALYYHSFMPLSPTLELIAAKRLAPERFS